ncbi:MAG: Gfo/Idh/MocA family oxidoreductase [Candidatus Poseidoniaceae archaeon]|nr:Gfo/Idh/MocA family oxidoreductase [Candidatus Poseidoniaceae archaeon]
MPISIGVVGCGRWGSIHLQTLLRMKREGTVNRIIACDADRTKLPPTTDIDAIYGGWERMCDSEPLDLVILATPNRTHEKIGLALLARGVRVLIEKPFSTSIEGTQRLIQEAEKNNTYTVSGYLLRHHAGIQRVRQLIDEKTLGEVIQITYTRYTNRPKPTEMPILEGLGSHGVDTLDYLVAGEHHLTFSSGLFEHPTDKPATIQTASSARFLFEGESQLHTNRFSATVEVGWGQSEERRELLVQGTKGKVSIDFGQHQRYTLDGVERDLGATKSPLEAQILDALARPTLPAEMAEALLRTTQRIESIKHQCV